MMEKLKNFFIKIKSVKNIELYVALVLAAVVVIIIFAGTAQKKSADSAGDNSYISQMEHKICSVIEKIDGCGKASVAISYASNEEKVYVYETETTSSGGVVKQSSSIVTYKGEPLVTKTLPPKILGVVVIAEGASDPVIKYQIVNVVVTLLDVQAKDVRVLTYKS